MKIGIYISGLGQSFVNETVEKYAERLKNEIDFNTVGLDYEIKKEKITYTAGRDSTVVSICEKNASGKGEGKVIYKFYDFKYHQILTEKFNNLPLIIKNVWLFLLVVKKFPLIIKRLFSPASYDQPLQTLYLFIIFLCMASAILFMLPATLAVFQSAQFNQVIVEIQNKISFLKDIPYISKADLQTFSKVIVSLTSFILLMLPNANILITNLATEFVCANDYMQHGLQKQIIQGNLELLVNHISENEKNSKIHFHTYSFGSILAIDYIYPFGYKPTKNAKSFCEAIITIGTPFEFIKAYYPQFYLNRETDLGDCLIWLNIYSIADALATNFRNDSEIGNAQFGIEKTSNKPININYEVAPSNNTGIIDFFMLYSVQVHGMYWDNKTEGNSCLGRIYEEMNNLNLIYNPCALPAPIAINT